ncbi:MAG: protein kinase, partial [Planctomycetota bacterium]
ALLERLRALEEAEPSLAPGTIFAGQYEIEERLGEGSYGQVFRARDLELDRAVAIKILRAGRFAGAGELDRFSREARSAAQLKHPGIVLLYGIGQTEDGLHFLVEELIAGRSLQAYLEEERPDPAAAARLTLEMASALAYAHGRGIVHRDLKPSNVLLDERGHPHLADFGLAKHQSEDSDMTPDGLALGTPGYMSPEQVRGANVDERSDVFALGVILYELLTGRRAFGGNPRGQLLAVLQEEPKPPRKCSPAVPRDLETIFLEALAKSPERRYATAAALADDLRRFLAGEPIRARRLGAIERTWRFARRYPLATAVFAAVCLGALLGIAHLSTLSHVLMRESAEASAGQITSILEEVNSHYSSTVVEPLRGRNVVSKRVPREPGTIPVPATFLTELGERISAGVTGMQVRHYSDHPFRTRKDGGPRDAFARSALQHLRADPSVPYLRYETVLGKPSLRYASARIMEPSCVDCHNTHADSTKTDWKVGDVRGVLEIIRPLDEHRDRARADLEGTYWLLGGAFGALLALALAAFVIGSVQRRA